MNGESAAQPEVLTIGHSTLELAQLIGILTANSVTLLLDVRTVPRSRHNPQYNRETLPGELERAGIHYLHESALGGLRRPTKDSRTSAWRNASFRGFADYMQSPAFTEAIDRLLKKAGEERIALMCAEAVPWRCHRSLAKREIRRLK